MLPEPFFKKAGVLDRHAASLMMLFFVFQVFNLLVEGVEDFPDCIELHFLPFQVAEAPLAGEPVQCVENLFLVG